MKIDRLKSILTRGVLARIASSCLLVPAFGGNALAGLPSAAVPAGFGVSIHHVRDPREWQWMADAGLRIVRLDMTWEKVEKKAGSYDWSYFDDIAAQLVTHGLRPLFILDYGNAAYSPQVVVANKGPSAPRRAAAPVQPHEVSAFVDFARAAVKRYQRFDPIWEIWNEPEHDQMWPPKSNVQQYVDLATRTCSAIRETDADATIIAPGAAKAPTDGDPAPELLRAMLSTKLASCLSAVSIHPYLFLNALDGTAKTWSRMRAMITRAESPRAGLDVASSESGISTFKGQISDDQQASYLVRMMMLNARSKVPISIWYDWSDDGSDPDNPEHRFGILRQDLSRKPAWYALQTMTRQLKDEQALCSALPPDADSTSIVFATPDLRSVHLAVWRAGRGEREVDVPIGNGAVLRSAVDMLGQPVATRPGERNALTITLGLAPVYLTVSGLSKASIDSLCTPDTSR